MYKFEDKELELASADYVENTISEEITDTEEVKELIKLGEKMIEFCADKGGAGLAAVQIGVPKQMFVWMNTPTTYQIIFNAKYFPDKKKTNVIEGCLTYPDQQYFVSRAKRITARYSILKDDKLYNMTNHFNKERAFIFQHESDHLNAKTIKQHGVFLSEDSKQNLGIA